jgi:hypothetical protein
MGLIPKYQHELALDEDLRIILKHVDGLIADRTVIVGLLSQIGSQTVSGTVISAGGTPERGWAYGATRYHVSTVQCYFTTQNGLTPGSALDCKLYGYTGLLETISVTFTGSLGECEFTADAIESALVADRLFSVTLEADGASDIACCAHLMPNTAKILKELEDDLYDWDGVV